MPTILLALRYKSAPTSRLIERDYARKKSGCQSRTNFLIAVRFVDFSSRTLCASDGNSASLAKRNEINWSTVNSRIRARSSGGSCSRMRGCDLPLTRPAILQRVPPANGHHHDFEELFPPDESIPREHRLCRCPLVQAPRFKLVLHKNLGAPRNYPTLRSEGRVSRSSRTKDVEVSYGVR